VHIFSISALNFRSYELVELNLNPGVTTFIGPNGQGKTNLIEIVDFTANLQSHRSNLNSNLIRNSAAFAQTRVGVKEENKKTWIETRIEEKKTLKIKVNSNPVKKHRDAVGLIKSTIFSPNDLYLVKGDPATRRGFLDEVLIQNDKNYYELKNEYEKVLKQKNALLKSIPKGEKNRTAAWSTLEVWNEKLASTGSQIIYFRKKIIDSLTTPFIKNYKEIAPHTTNLQIGYNSNVNTTNLTVEEIYNSFIQELENRKEDELIRSTSLVGPHRDDFEIELNSLPAKSQSSQGESWSIALCLKLAMFDLLKENYKPILILDDVFSELDQHRREFLLKKIQDTEQTIITAAVEEDTPKNLLGEKYFINNNEITNES
jgi:DNA replication and repair protein RecF